MKGTTPRKKREVPVTPPGFLATQDLKDRGWTPALISRFLGEHDATRPNGLRMGRRRLPPVKLYGEPRVLDIERQDTFLAAQARAADARERAAQAREKRALHRARLLEAAAASYAPVIQPGPLRKGAVRQARAPYLSDLSAAVKRLAAEVGKLTAREETVLETLLRARLDSALAATYPWYPAPGQAQAAKAATTAADKVGQTAHPSDWRAWDWD